MCFPQAQQAQQAKLRVHFNLLTVGGPFELNVTRVKRNSFLGDRTRSRPSWTLETLNPLPAVLLARICRHTGGGLPASSTASQLIAEKANSYDTTAQIFTSPGTARKRSACQGEKAKARLYVIWLEPVNTFFDGAKVVTSVSARGGESSFLRTSKYVCARPELDHLQTPKLELVTIRHCDLQP